VLQQSAEIVIGLFTGHAACGNVVLLALGISGTALRFVGHVHTVHRVCVHDETMRSSLVEARHRPPDFQAFVQPAIRYLCLVAYYA